MKLCHTNIYQILVYVEYSLLEWIYYAIHNIANRSRNLKLWNIIVTYLVSDHKEKQIRVSQTEYIWWKIYGEVPIQTNCRLTSNIFTSSCFVAFRQYINTTSPVKRVKSADPRLQQHKAVKHVSICFISLWLLRMMLPHCSSKWVKRVTAMQDNMEVTLDAISIDI